MRKQTNRKAWKKAFCFGLIFTLLLSLISVGGIGTTFVEAAGSGEERYEYELITDTEIKITKYIGDSSVIDIPKRIDGKDVKQIAKDAFRDCTFLKQVIILANVTSIGNYAFAGCKNLEDIKIPTTVTSIGAYAFKGCSKLKTLRYTDSIPSDGTYELPTGLTDLPTLPGIGKGAFQGCTKLETIEIPEGVTSINKNTFKGCSNLTSIKLKNITAIKDGAFQDCSKLTEIAIPEGVTEIGTGAFQRCSALNKISFTGATSGTAITTIGERAFQDCSKLTEIAIPDSVKEIKDYAFQGCNKLTKINIPKAVQEIGKGVFSGCRKLKEITVADGSTTYTSKLGDTECNAIFTKDGTTLVVGCSGTDFEEIAKSGITTIGNGALADCGKLNDITIPDGVTTIGEEAFAGSIITSITFPTTITGGAIGESAFQNCKGLTEVVIPDGVKTIGAYAFQNCVTLKSITIPESVTSKIKADWFIGCDNLKDIYYCGSEDNWKKLYCGTDNADKWEAIKETINKSVIVHYDYQPVKKDGDYEYQILVEKDGNNIKIVKYIGDSSEPIIPSTIPTTNGNPVTVIGEGAFRDSDVTKITIPESVESIGTLAFAYCSNLEAVTVAGITSIGESAFWGCNNLKEISIAKVTKIGKNAFDGCSSLQSIFIPKSVTSIGSKAFWDCDNMTDIYYEGSQSEWDEFGLKKDKDLNSECVVHVDYTEQITEDDNSKYEYEEIDTGESGPEGNIYTITITKYTGTDEKVVIPTQIRGKDVTVIGYSAFYGNTSVKTVTIPSTVTTIEDGAFWGCSAMTKITIPSKVTKIGENAFYQSGLTAITIPESVTEIEKDAFAGCTSLKEVTILSSNPTTIGENAFYQSGLTKITIPESVTTIGKSAFAGCTSLKEVTILGSNLTTIEENAFADCASLIEVTISSTPTTIAQIGKNAFSNCNQLSTIEIDGVDTIGAMVFSNSALNTITLKNVKNIEANAFSGCTKLQTINLENVTGNWDGAFAGCTSLTTIELKDINSIAENAFADCTSLTTIDLKGITTIGAGAFSKSGLTAIAIPESVTTIGKSAFAACSELNTISMDANPEVEEGAFSDCNKLTSVTWNGTTIGNMFAGCTSLKDVVIPDGVTTIPTNAFAGCSGLTKINIPTTVTTIEANAFDGSGLTEIIIPASVTNIGASAFANCAELITVYFPDGVSKSNIEENMFDGCSALENIYCYGSKEYWDGLGITTPNGCTVHYHYYDNVTKEEENLVYRYTILDDGTIELTEYKKTETNPIEIPNKIDGKSVTRIRKSLLKELNKTQKITIAIPSSVIYIEKDTFSGFTNLMIYCEEGSYTALYAQQNKIEFKLIQQLSSDSADDGSLLVWVNGKDIKDNASTEEDETAYYKTNIYDILGSEESGIRYSGGKLEVVVTTEDVKSPEQLIGLYGENAKLNKTSTEIVDAKKIATAKLKDGIITITAGKESGRVNVWLLEIRNKEIVNTKNIYPTFYPVEVHKAPISLVLKREDSDETIKTLELMYNASPDLKKDPVEITVLDTKGDIDSKARFKVTSKEEGIVDTYISGNKLFVTPSQAGQTTLTVTNVQSSKTVKVKVKVVASYKVTFTDEFIVTYKSGKNTISVKNGDFVPTNTKLTISASGKNFKINAGDTLSGTVTYKIGEEDINITIDNTPTE